jgi:hypothetical protein
VFFFPKWVCHVPHRDLTSGLGSVCKYQESGDKKAKAKEYPC